MGGEGRGGEGGRGEEMGGERRRRREGRVEEMGGEGGGYSSTSFQNLV